MSIRPAAFISALSLSHFRSYKSLQLSSDARAVVFYGANGAGKTNLLEALSLLSPGRGLRRLANEDFMRRPEKIGWKISARLSSAERENALEVTYRAGEIRKISIDAKAAPQLRLGALMRVLWLVPAMDRLWVDGAEQRRRFFDRITMSFFPDHAASVLGYDKALRERNRLLRDQIKDVHWYQALEGRMGQFGAAIIANRLNAVARLSEASEGAGALHFPQAGLSLVEPDGMVLPQQAEALSADLAHYRARDLAAGRSLLGPHRTDLRALFLARNTSAAECSTGEQKALLISVILNNLRALLVKEKAPAILLLDEVAAHLDPGRCNALYQALLELGVQVWITGTDRSLFSGLEGQAMFCRVEEKETCSEIVVEST